MSLRSSWLAKGLTMIILSIPWLNPFAAGPSPATLPWLVSSLCAVVGCWVFLWQKGAMRPSLLARVWTFSALLSSLFGLMQYLGVIAPDSLLINFASTGEAFANLRQRNQFASLVNIGLVAVIWSVAYGMPARVVPDTRFRFAHLNWSSIAALAAAVLLGVGNAASSSRTGLLQVILVVVLFWWWGALRLAATRNVVWAALLAYAVASLALPMMIGLEFGSSGILGRLGDAGAGCSSRLTLWSNVLHLIAQKPWFGWGWGELDFAHFVTLYPGPRFCEILDNAHNLPLHLAVELGVPVATAICVCVLLLVWRARLWRERDGTRQMAWGVLAVIMLHSLLEYPLWYGPFQMAFGLCIWLLCVTPPITGENRTKKAVNFAVLEVGNEKKWSNMTLARVFIGFSAIFIIAIISYAAWDYHRISQIYLAPSQRSEAYRSNTLAKIQGSWLFENQVKFAELTTASLTVANAAHLNALALDLLHFSPEARVAEKLIESAELLGKFEQADFYSVRFRAAFPLEYAQWAKANPSPSR